MLLQILITIGASQALALSILLLLKRHKKLADHLLSLTLMLMFAIIMLFNYRYELLATRLPICLHSFTLAYLALPVFYQYIRTSTKTECDGSWRKTWPHFIPFLTVVGLMSYFYLPMPLAQQAELLTTIHTGSGPLWFQLVYFGLFLGMFPLYLWLCLRELQQHEHYVVTCFSYKEDVSLNWLNRFVWSLAIVWVGFIVFEVVGGRMYTAPMAESGMYLAFLVFVGSISYLGLYGLRQQAIFLDPVPAPTQTKIETQPQQTETERDPLPVQEREAALAHLQHIMHKHEPHRQPRLTISELAELCDMPAHQLSRLLNEELGQHFFDFINQYRVQTFQELVTEPQNESYTLLALAYDAGFNSKSTFNAIFKKTTGMTPSAYVRQLRQSGHIEPTTI